MGMSFVVTMEVKSCRGLSESCVIGLCPPASSSISIFMTLLGVTASKMQDDAEPLGLTRPTFHSFTERGARMGRLECEGERLKSKE